MVHSGNRATSVFQEGAQLCSGFASRVEGARSRGVLSHGGFRVTTTGGLWQGEKTRREML